MSLSPPAMPAPSPQLAKQAGVDVGTEAAKPRDHHHAVHAVYETACTSEQCGRQGQVRSDGEWLLNGARVTENDRSSVFDPRSSYAYSLQTANSALRSEILLNAGQQ